MSTKPAPKRGQGGDHGKGRGSYAHLAKREAAEAAALAEAHFAQTVKLCLRLRGLEYAEVAPALGIGVGTLADKLNGRSKVSIGEAAQMAAVLNVALASLIDRSTPVSEFFAWAER